MRHPRLRLLLLFVITLNAGQQLSGINAVFYYSTLVFRSAGLDSTQSAVATLCIFLANVFMSATALLLLRFFRRRTLLTVSLVGMILCLITLVAALTAVEQQNKGNPESSPLLPVPPQTQLFNGSALRLVHQTNETNKGSGLDHGGDVSILRLNGSADGAFKKFLSINEAARKCSEEGASGDLEKCISSRAGLAAEGVASAATISWNGSKREDHNETVALVTDGSDNEVEQSRTAGLLAMVAMVMYVVFYGVGMGPIPFCYAAETFPAGPRGEAVAAGGAANWVGNLVVGLLFPLLQRLLHHYSFVVFTLVVLMLLALVLWKLPEPSSVCEDTGHPSALGGVDTSSEPSTEAENLVPHGPL